MNTNNPHLTCYICGSRATARVRIVSDDHTWVSGEALCDKHMIATNRHIHDWLDEQEVEYKNKHVSN